MNRFRKTILPACLLAALSAMATSPFPLENAAGTRLLPPAGSQTDESLPGMSRIGATGSTIYGFQSYQDVDGFVSGWYEIAPDGTATRKWDYQYGPMGVSLNNGWMANGRLCGFAVMHMGSEDILGAFAYQELNPETGEVLLSRDIDVSESFLPYFYSCAYKPSENRIYGFGKDDRMGDQYYFKSAPADHPEQAQIISTLTMPGHRCYSFCYSSADDCFYGVNTFGKLVRVQTDGTITELFDVPVNSLANSKGALTVSPYDGYLLWNPGVYETVSELYAIYPDEQRMERLHRFGTDCQFSFFVSPDDDFTSASIAAPAYLGNTFAGASLSGELRFRLPAKDLQGNAISGQCEWQLYDNGTRCATGFAAAGSEVSVPVQTTQGMHTFRLEASLGDKNGYPGVAHIYTGHDTPNTPAGISLTPTEIRWDVVTEGVHKGYLDTSAILYHVYLNDTDLGTTTSTSMAVSIDSDKIQDVYYAYVVAEANSMSSDRGASNKAIIGKPYPLPMTILPTEHDGEMVTIINADGSPDFGVWRLSDQWGDLCFASGWSVEQPDDWLILPAADFTSNTVVYQIAIEAARGGYTGQREYFEVWAGTEPTVEAMTIPVIAKTRAQKFNDWKEYTGMFSVPRPGKYYIAVRSVSDPDQKDLIVRNIRVTATETTAAVPDKVQNLAIASTSDADLNVTLSFDMPSKYINGEDIAASEVVTVHATDAAGTVSTTGTPGQAMQLVVPTVQGDNYITVMTEVNGIEGQKAEVSTFTGMDHLSYVENFNGVISEDDMSIHLTWDAPLGSLNGGYVASTGIEYCIGQIESDGSFIGETVTVGPDVTEYDYTLPSGSPQQSVRVGIAPVNAAGISPARSFISRVIGTPHTLPVDEDFDDMTIKYQVLSISAPDSRYADGNMTWCQPELVDPEYANDEIEYAIIGYTDSESARVRMGLPKVSTVGAELPTAVLTLWNGRGAAKMSVYALTYGMAAPEKIADITPGTGWEDIVIPIPEKFKNRPWMSIYIDGELASAETYVILGRYRITPVSGMTEIMDMDNVRTVKGGIIIDGAAGSEYSVYSADGLRIAAGTLNGTTVVNTTAGIYVIRLGDRSTKVMVP